MVSNWAWRSRPEHAPASARTLNDRVRDQLGHSVGDGRDKVGIVRAAHPEHRPTADPHLVHYATGPQSPARSGASARRCRQDRPGIHIVGEGQGGSHRAHIADDGAGMTRRCARQARLRRSFARTRTTVSIWGSTPTLRRRIAAKARSRCPGGCRTRAGGGRSSASALTRPGNTTSKSAIIAGTLTRYGHPIITRSRRVIPVTGCVQGTSS